MYLQSFFSHAANPGALFTDPLSHCRFDTELCQPGQLRLRGIQIDFFYKIKAKQIFVKISGKSPLFDPIVKSDLF